jgi:hypothetical protein
MAATWVGADESPPHPCPIRLCVRDNLPPKWLMCPAHWRICPRPLQRAVNDAYDLGRGMGSPELHAAQIAAIKAVNRRLEVTEDA